MTCEISQELLNELTSEIPDLGSIIPEKRQPSLFRKAEAIIQACGNGKKGEPKKTDRLLSNVNDKKVVLQLLENPPGFSLKIGVFSHTSGERGELDIKIGEKETLWGEDAASDDQLTTALRLITHLQRYGLSPALSAEERWQYERDSKLSFRYWSYELDKQRFGP